MSPPLRLVPSGLLLCGRCVVPLRCLLASTPAILRLLDGLLVLILAFHFVSARFRMMRRYLAYCLDEAHRIFRMLDLICREGPGSRSCPSSSYLCC